MHLDHDGMHSTSLG